MRPGFILVMGSIFLPLLLVLSASGFILVKVIAKDQEQVIAATQDRFNTASFRYTLSQYIDTPKDWEVYESKNLSYKVKHPSSWKTEENIKEGPNIVGSYQAYLSEKITLTVTVRNHYEIPETGKKIELGGNTFNILEDKASLKSAVIKHGRNYYLIELAENNFFGDSVEFKGAFFQFLKNFEFTS